MATWTEQYLAALQARDAVESANLELYDYCTRLADEKAELEKKARLAERAPSSEDASAVPEPATAAGWGIRRVTSPATRPESPTSNTTQTAQLRSDLSKAQSERADLQTRLDVTLRELEALKGKSKADNKQILHLNASINRLKIKVGDREEELRGKAKLIENVQDENVTLHLQLNMAEQQAAKLKKENQELVDRWMARMGKEADRMNEEGKFG
ncbi:autophagy protein 16, interacts with Atg12p-Atg5p [Cladophialophora chaetospira]|uniref:Autophagy protein 16, interacts with Atg12p-Atg5p n=1 Tax=Cladophialophora chaetospira TaxID=386627 RepID=A0AA38WXG0_9EURO|nr:autophagy protein 16, interacts with Atg12p-Atg5p [Cladophialophora chaetospira]